MNSSARRSLLRVSGVLAGLAIIVLDRVTKRLVEAYFAGHPTGSVEVIGDFVRLTHVRNRGMVFGFLSGHDFAYRDTVLVAISAVAIVGLAVAFLRMPALGRAGGLGLALVIGGAIGNLIDRVRWGYVVDFVDVSLYFTRWPAFNVADAAICTGVGLMLLALHRDEPAAEAPSPQPDAPA